MQLTPLVSTFRGKVILLAMGIALLTSATITTLSYWRFKDFSYDQAFASLNAEAQHKAELLRVPFSMMERDAEVLFGTPPIYGLIRATADPFRFDPKDGSPAGEWRRRLETIFSALILARAHYTQVRYIGLANQGRELVRVDATPDGPRPTPLTALQSKADEPYFAPLLEQTVPHPYFSGITLNREFGRVSDTPTPTIRIVHPVVGPDGQLFGALLINADIEMLMRQVDLHADP